MNSSTKIGLLFAIVLLSRSMSRPSAHPLVGTSRELTEVTGDTISSGVRGSTASLPPSLSKNNIKSGVRKLRGNQASRKIELDDEESYVMVDYPWWSPNVNSLSKDEKTTVPKPSGKKALARTASPTMLVDGEKLKGSIGTNTPPTADTRVAIVEELHEAEENHIDLDQQSTPAPGKSEQATIAEIKDPGPAEKSEDTKTELAKKDERKDVGTAEKSEDVKTELAKKAGPKEIVPQRPPRNVLRQRPRTLNSDYSFLLKDMGGYTFPNLGLPNFDIANLFFR